MPAAPAHREISLSDSAPAAESAELGAARSASRYMESAQSFPELTSAIRDANMLTLVAGEDSAVVTAVKRSEQYVQGLVKGDEAVLLAWPVVSVNEWGTQQRRVLVLTSQAMYRLQFKEGRGAVDHYARTSLGSMRRLERGKLGYRLILTEPDGRENPFSFAWSEATRSKSDTRYERIYYPRVSADARGVAAVEPIIELTTSAINHANRLLVENVGRHIHVSRLQLTDYQPSPNHFDRVIEKVAAAGETAVEKSAPYVEKAGTKIKGAWSSFRKR